MEICVGLSTCENLELDKNWWLVFELPETDSLFEEKKDLLQKKGFKTSKERIIFGDVSEVEVDGVLEQMLTIERIIQLDEVELYFFEDVWPLNSYSHRNEVVALNLIRQRAENALRNCTSIQKNVFTELRRCTIERIRILHDEDSMKAVIEEDRCCDKEKSLLQWGEDNGIVSRLRVAYVEGAGRGAIAREDLEVGDTVLEIPVSMIISQELVKTSDMYPILEKRSEISCDTMVLLWSMKEKYNTSSKFKLYFDTLPEKFNTGLSFGLDALVVLDETIMFDEITQAKQHLRTQYDELVSSLCIEYPSVFPRELYTWEKFLWACELWYSNSMKIMFPDGELMTCLVPVAGFLNHSLRPHVMNYGKVDPTTNTLKFTLSTPCGAREECFLSYGNHSSSHLITFYGFIPKGDNPYDVIPLELECQENDIFEGSDVSSVTHMVRGRWFLHNDGIFEYRLPSRLLDFLRRSQNPLLHTKLHLQESLECEMEILNQLSCNFSGLKERLGESDLDEREDARWDVRLAVMYKDTQRRIVDSVISSCNLGRDLVESQFCICMEEDMRG